MSKIFGSSGRVSDPLSNLGVLLGVLGAAISAILWFSFFRPNSTVLGSYASQVVEGGPLHDQAKVLAMFFGVFALSFGIGASLGGRGRASSAAAVVLGVASLSYPVLTYFDVFSRIVPRPL